MLDAQFVREHLEEVRRNCRNRNVQADVEGVVRLDDERRRVLQATQTMQQRQNEIQKLMQKEKDPAKKQESFDCRPPEAPAPDIITEHGVRFRVAPGSKHKTGFFVDQRDNRRTLASFCAGRRVLDLCCNTGGFAVYAKVLGHAEEVIGVDLDEQALEMARQNANLNQARVRFVQADLFPWLRDSIANGERFDVVVLDPAKQTRDRESVDYALKRYLDMNRLALLAIAPGGIFLTCSCTGLVSEENFLESLRRAAWQAGRALQVLRITGAGADHPFLMSVPEGRYLKAVFCRVE
jgi:23S rRNA (cytosine1962-C5)-methyltransferase